MADGIGGLEDLIEAQARVLVYDDPDIPPILPVITGTTVLLRLLREELEGLYMGNLSAGGPFGPPCLLLRG